MWEKGWVEGACSEVGVGRGRTTSRDGLNEQQSRVTEDTQHINRRETADGREMPKAVSRGKRLVIVKERDDLPEPEVQVLLAAPGVGAVTHLSSWRESAGGCGGAAAVAWWRSCCCVALQWWGSGQDVAAHAASHRSCL